MPTFMQSLAANPSNTNQSGIYGQPGGLNQSSELGLINQIKEMDLKNFEDKANFMSDLSLKQDRMRRIYDMQDRKQDQLMNANQPQNQQNMQTMQDPNQMTGYQKGELGIKQKELEQGQQKLAQEKDLEQQKLAQQKDFGQQALDVKKAQEKLNQQKSDQINATKQADLQRKMDEATQNFKLANDKLQQAGNNFNARLQAQKDLAAAAEERHKAEMAMKQHQFDTIHDQMQHRIDQQDKAINQKGRTKTTTEVNPDGTKKTVTTERGNATDTVQVTGKDGKSYTIPKDKLDDWNSNHAPDNSNNQDNNNQQD